MARKELSDLTLPQITLLALVAALALFILSLSIWITTTKPVRLRVLGQTCPEYPIAPQGCKYGITTGTDQNGCLTINCYQPHH